MQYQRASVGRPHDSMTSIQCHGGHLLGSIFHTGLKGGREEDWSGEDVRSEAFLSSRSHKLTSRQ